jgi:hypothetical protein
MYLSTCLNGSAHAECPLLPRDLAAFCSDVQYSNVGKQTVLDKGEGKGMWFNATAGIAQSV